MFKSGACGCCERKSLLRQPVRQGPLQMLLVAPLEDERFPQSILALAILAQGQVVPAARLARLDLAGGRHAEPLHRAPLRLQLRHLAVLFRNEERRFLHAPERCVKPWGPRPEPAPRSERPARLPAGRSVGAAAAVWADAAAAPPGPPCAPAARASTAASADWARGS